MKKNKRNEIIINKWIQKTKWIKYKEDRRGKWMINYKNWIGLFKILSMVKVK